MKENPRLKAVRAVRAELAAVGIDPFGVQIDRIVSPTEGIIDGRPTILAGTNKNEWGLFVELASISGSAIIQI